MKQRTSYYVSRKSALTWVAALILLGSIGDRIAMFAGKEANSTTLWLQIILPSAACLIYTLRLLLSGKEYFYQSSRAVFLFAVYFTFRVPTAFIWSPAAIFVIYTLTMGGKVNKNFVLLPLLAATLLCRLTVRSGFWISDGLILFGVFTAALAMRPHADGKYHKIWGDRSDGRRVRTITPIAYVTPYIMPNRNGASNFILQALEISAVEDYIHQKRREGLAGFGIIHVFIAAYVRCVSQYPALNRFLSGQHVYSRDENILFSMIVKKEMTTEAPDTAIKLHLNPGDTVYDVYEKFRHAVEEVKGAPLDSTFDQVAAALKLIPGVFLKFVIWFLKLLDYFGLLPRFLLEVSPFHSSVFFTSMGSLGISAVVHHLYDFGNLPAFIALGCKRRATELDSSGNPVQKRYVDCSFNLDERTVDGFYYAEALKYLKRLFVHPERLDEKPKKVIHDIN